jgi:hypothetical protein
MPINLIIDRCTEPFTEDLSKIQGNDAEYRQNDAGCTIAPDEPTAEAIAPLICPAAQHQPAASPQKALETNAA